MSPKPVVDISSAEPLYDRYILVYTDATSRGVRAVKRRNTEMSHSDGTPISTLKTDEEALVTLFGVEELTELPAVLGANAGVIHVVCQGAKDASRWIRGAVTGKPKKVVSSSKPCAALTNSGVTYKKKCCGGKVRETPINICHTTVMTNRRDCMHCTERVEVEDEMTQDIRDRIAANADKVIEKIQAEIAAGRAVE